jgi:2-polyprenyl-3-methyl-5-hydroxy-6-metoxy-1,4-benzoquinol methylase
MEPSQKPIGLGLLPLRGDKYGEYVRRELLDRLEAPLGRVLDVGCACGAGADALRRLGATRL